MTINTKYRKKIQFVTTQNITCWLNPETKDNEMTSKKDAWRDIAEVELRGRSVDDLTWNTPEGIEVQPI